MADKPNPKTTTTNAAPAATAAGAFNPADYLPKGHDADKLKKTGGLTPMYKPDAAVQHGFPPAAGWINRIEVLPTQAVGTKDEFTPICIYLCDLEKPTKGVTGKEPNSKIVDREAGDDLMVPVTGNLTNNKQLIQALTDLKHRYFAIFHCTGEKVKLAGRPSPMNVVDVYISGTVELREKSPAYFLPVEYVAANARGEIAAAIKERDASILGRGAVRHDGDGVVEERQLASAPS
jgi:hypothetical protein